MRRKIFVTVTGGVAEVCEDTVPYGYEVEIIDFDNIKAGSVEAAQYCGRKLPNSMIEKVKAYLRSWWERHICADYPYDDTM
jgi:methyl coenzyme M reductase subunit D